ncbi:MAG: hypothetical protein JNL05_01255 [Flavobacteriales bacterium]|nr:hypothetical protein [Flavobacteriales bacterium]
MFVNLFRRNQPVVLFLLVLLVPLTWPGPLAGAAHAREQLAGGMPLAQAVGGLLADLPWLAWVLGLVLTAALALQFDQLANRAGLFDRPNHLVALLLPATLVLGPNGGWADPALLGLPFVTWSMVRAWAVQGRSQVFGELFDAGLLLGLATLWYVPYAFVVVAVWAGVAVMRPFQWRDYLLPVLGMGVVLFLAWGVLRLSGAAPWEPLRTVATGAATAVHHRSALWLAFMLLLVLPMALIGIKAFLDHYQRCIMREKNVRSAFVALSLVMVVLVTFELLLNGTFPSALLAAPMAVVMGYGLLRPRRVFLAELAFLGLVAGAAWMRWGG